MTNDPAWLTAFRLNVRVRQQIIVSGNVRDLCARPTGPAGPGTSEPLVSRKPVVETLIAAMLEDGLAAVVVLDPIDGLLVRCQGPGSPVLAAIAKAVRATDLKADTWRPVSEEDRTSILQSLARLPDAGIAILVDYASRLMRVPGHPERSEWALFAAAEKLLHRLDTPNPVVWVLEREADLPEFLLTDHPAMARLRVPLPSADERSKLAHTLLAKPSDGAAPLADLTDGLPLRSLIIVHKLAKALQSKPVSSETPPVPGATEILRAVQLYKHGLHDNPWQQGTVMAKLLDAESALKRAVKGQDLAVAETVDRLKRSVVGMSGAQGSPNSKRPRAVMMLAGPTGVGKTELVRALTRHLFGSEEMYTRFDMSEFSAPHSEQRLIGAPPSYVGFEQGGELTNAMRVKPFSVLLFDEIDKAHPQILDKFLQILEDGRLTDGRGHTVYFSESLIFFTTNLGVYRPVLNPGPGEPERELAVPYGAPYEHLRGEIRKGITRAFQIDIGRPELENRLGENIVIFDFIREPAMIEILRLMLDRVCARARAQDFDVALDDAVFSDLLGWSRTACATFGGRGIGNVVEQCLVNPLAREMFSRNTANKRGRINVAAIVANGGMDGTFGLRCQP